MSGYLFRRLLEAIPTVLGVVSIVFVIVRFAPGDPIDYMISQYQLQISKETAATMRARYGLDRPIWYQYAAFMTRAVHGDLGLSITEHRPVLSMLVPRIGPTLELAAGGAAVGVLIGVPTGIVSAVRPGSAVDHLLMTAAVTWVSMPSFWLALLLVYVFGYLLPVFPMFGSGTGSGALSVLWHLALPALAVGAPLSAVLARVGRSAMLEALHGDYCRTASAKGVSKRMVIYRHALRNAAISLVTVLGIDLAYLVGGTVVVETVFARTGLGKLLIDAIDVRDYPVIQGAIILFATGVVLVNVAVDLLYAVLDPRIRFG